MWSQEAGAWAPRSWYSPSPDFADQASEAVPVLGVPRGPATVPSATGPRSDRGSRGTAPQPGLVPTGGSCWTSSHGSSSVAPRHLVSLALTRGTSDGIGMRGPTVLGVVVLQ